MISVFVTFIRVVYGRMIYMSLSFKGKTILCYAENLCPSKAKQYCVMQKMQKRDLFPMQERGLKFNQTIKGEIRFVRYMPNFRKTITPFLSSEKAFV